MELFELIKKLTIVFCLFFLASCYKKAESVKENSNISVFPIVGEMVLIPKGEFIMGASEKYGVLGVEVCGSCVPEHQVYLKSFYIDKYEVTVSQYKVFMSAARHSPPLQWTSLYMKDSPLPAVRETEPITDVSWYDADAYCQWVGKRLPAEEEWEKAARGTDGRRFPWGNEWKEEIANTIEYYFKHNKKEVYISTFTVAEAGSFKGDVSPYGVYDMGGNVLEWTSSWFKPYPGNESQRDAFEETYKVVRGGSWMMDASYSFVFNRVEHTPDINNPDFGFRCAKDAEDNNER